MYYTYCLLIVLYKYVMCGYYNLLYFIYLYIMTYIINNYC